MRVPEKFLNKEPYCDPHPAKDSEHPNRPEKVQRAPKILQQETDSNQVKKYAEGTRDSVMRNSAFTVHVANRHFADGRSVRGRQRRNKPVQFAVKWNLFQNLAAIRFERGAEVVNIHTAKFSHQPVGAARRNAAQPEVVDADFAPAAYDVVALGNFLKEQGDVRGIMLQIAVHGDDVLTASMIEACGQCRSLPKIPSQADNRDPAVHPGNLAQQLKRFV